MSPRPMRTLVRTTLRSTWIVTICAASVFSQFWMSPRAAAQQVSQLEFIDQPQDWVPFSARVTMTSPDSAGPATVGLFFRGSDGSTRMATGPSWTDVRVISITNVVAQTVYIYSARNGWVSHPMSLPAGGYHPMRFRTTFPGLKKYPNRLALEVGQDGSLTATEGFEAYRQLNGQSIFKLLVPALNMFEVVTQRPDGVLQVFSDIKIDEQPADLFEPPPGATIQVSTTPMGRTVVIPPR
jgi:hypothetical protein